MSCAVLSNLSWAEVYKWVDEHGQVHFGDQPPPARSAETVEVKTTPKPSGSDRDYQDSVLRQKQLAEELAKERAQRQQALQKEREKQAAKEHQCKKLAAQIQHQKSISMMFRFNDQGKREYYTDQQREAYRQKLEKLYQDVALNSAASGAGQVWPDSRASGLNQGPIHSLGWFLQSPFEEFRLCQGTLVDFGIIILGLKGLACGCLESELTQVDRLAGHGA